MFNAIRTNALASFCFFALILAAAVGVTEAQSATPIEDDEILACVTVGDEVWAAPVALKQALEDATGMNATVESMADLLDRLPPANNGNGVRFEGGVPSISVQQDLDDLGYGTQVALAVPAVPGATVAVRRIV
ncbi:MAG: hypothetical protein P1V36_12495 [Planctomycetota bacterium]|nr:hypothetical protein [Planctomycetota bacterium]